MTTLEKICAELLTRWQEYSDSNDSAAAHERYMRFAGIHGMKLAKACLEMKATLEKMHNILKNRHHESHSSLMTNPTQNGCLVYSEWKLKELKELCIKEVEDILK